MEPVTFESYVLITDLCNGPKDKALDTVKKLITHDYVNYDWDIAFRLACDFKNLEMIKIIVDGDDAFHDKNKDTLHPKIDCDREMNFACKHNSIEIVKFMINRVSITLRHVSDAMEYIYHELSKIMIDK